MERSKEHKELLNKMDDKTISLLELKRLQALQSEELKAVGLVVVKPCKS